jgi:glycosyltransferase involved in cell wall biosynthesis
MVSETMLTMDKEDGRASPDRWTDGPSLHLGMGWLSEQAGGLNRYTFQLSQALARLKVEQTWLVTGTGPVEVEPAEVAVRVAADPSASLSSRFRGLRDAWREAAVEPPSFVASHFALYAYPLRKYLRALPHVVHFHGPWAAETRAEGAPAWKSWLQKRQELAVYRTADRTITLSKTFARVAAEDYGISEASIRVIPGGVDLERFSVDGSREQAREQLDLPRDRPIAVCVRRLARRMGMVELIEAIEQVRKHNPDMLLLIGGKGSLQGQLTEQINTLGLQDHVRLLGFIPDEQLASYYRASDFSIVPTQALEGFGLIVLESMACGTPVLVTPVGGLPEIVQPFSPELVFENPSPEAMAERIGEVLAGRVALPSSEQCREHVEEFYRWERVAQRVLEVYREASRE